MSIPLASIACQFTSAAVDRISPLGNGLINDTYRVDTPSSPFVLQRLNTKVFPVPKQIMDNLAVFSEHISQKNLVKLQFPDIVKTTANETLYQDENGDYWRALTFIAESESIEAIRCDSDAEQAGFALGHFHRLVGDLKPSRLHDTLPGFHIAPDYLKHYQTATQQPSKPENRYCAEFIARHQTMVDDLETAKLQGLLTIRAIHGDPKLNNFLFGQQCKKVVSIIDLDTIKPGLVHYDIGDCVRSCCYSPESGKFDLDTCATLLKNYLTEVSPFFTEADYHYVYAAIRLIPFELGIRFYTDYLEGDRYFKVTDPEQNLQRSIGQFQLCEKVMALEPILRKLIMQLKQSICLH